MMRRCLPWILGVVFFTAAQLAPAQDRTEKATFKGHTNNVFAVAFSRDGTLLASGSTDQTVKVWDVKNVKELMTLKGHTFSVRSVAFSPDGKYLATGGHDGVVIIWDLATKKPVAELSVRDFVQTVVFSPDGKSLITASNGGLFDKPYSHIRLWDTGTHKEIRKIDCPQFLSWMSVSGDAKVAAAGFSDSPVRLYDLTNGKELAVIGEANRADGRLAISSDGKTVAAGINFEVKVWDVATSKFVHTLKPKPEKGELQAVAISPDGKVVAAASVDFDDPKVNRYRLDLWSLQSGKHLASCKGHTAEVVELTFSPDGRTLAAASRDNTIKVWDVPAGE
jgi:WD40 repeat protein